MSKTAFLTIIYSTFVLVLSGCAHMVDNVLALDKVHIKQTSVSNADNVIEVSIKAETKSDSVLDVQFLGVGGFAFVVNGEKIITAPSYTNPSFLSNLPWVSVEPDKEKIDRLFPDYLDDKFDANDHNVKAIIVGHSHYDHLLDVPYLMQSVLEDSKAYGSKTMSMILSTYGLSRADYPPVESFEENNYPRESRAIAIDARADKGWVTIDKNTRIFPIKAYHPPHLLGITFQGGVYGEGDVPDMKTAWDWRLGEVYSYLIDFLADDGDILYRIYYQDTATTVNASKALDKTLSDRPVDIAVVMLANFAHSKNSLIRSLTLLMSEINCICTKRLASFGMREVVLMTMVERQCQW